MPVVAGVDGCRTGWLSVTKDLATGAMQVRLLKSISELRQFTPRPDVALIDIPIGLSDAGPRACDTAARALLRRPRSSSVFPAPIRPMLGAKSYAAACDIGIATDGRKLSRQTWNLLGKIREVDDLLAKQPEWQGRLREVHPELSFWAWNGERAMEHRKKSPEGRLEREALVKSRYSAPYELAQRSLTSGEYANDDLLDAFAALWSAERVAAGQALSLPTRPPVDRRGLRMEIVV